MAAGCAGRTGPLAVCLLPALPFAIKHKVRNVEITDKRGVLFWLSDRTRVPMHHCWQLTNVAESTHADAIIKAECGVWDANNNGVGSFIVIFLAKNYF